LNESFARLVSFSSQMRSSTLPISAWRAGAAVDQGERSLKHRVEDGDDVSVARGLPSWSTQAHLAIDALGAVAVAATPF
jgi:hypothetical protein